MIFREGQGNKGNTGTVSRDFRVRREGSLRARPTERTLASATERAKEANENAVTEAKKLMEEVQRAEDAFQKSQTSRREQDTILADRAVENARLKVAGFLRANEERIRRTAKDEWDAWVETYGPLIEKIAPALEQGESEYHALLAEKNDMGSLDPKKERQLEILVDAMVGIGNDARLGRPEAEASRKRRKNPLDAREAFLYLRSIEVSHTAAADAA